LKEKLWEVLKKKYDHIASEKKNTFYEN